MVGVGISEQQPLARCVLLSRVTGVALASPAGWRSVTVNDRDGIATRDIARAVGRGVIDDDHLSRLITLRKQRLDDAHDVARLGTGGNHDRNEGMVWRLFLARPYRRKANEIAPRSSPERGFGRGESCQCRAQDGSSKAGPH